MRLGEVQNQTGPVRDAVHVAVIRVRCGTLKAGTKVKFTDSLWTKVVSCDDSGMHGIVDPFLKESNEDDFVLVILKPDIASNIRHHFDVPVNEAATEEEIDIPDYGCQFC